MHRSTLGVSVLCAASLFYTPTTFAQEKKRTQASLEEVVVTARRRDESLQETPVAVSALGEQALIDAGVSTITDLQQSVPGLQFGESGSKTPAIFIRGIGQRESSAVLDPGVGVYLNNIFIARQDGQLLDTVDTQSIQVLRGPQGTLFGKNNTGGAMLVTTKEPHFEQFEWGFSSKVGDQGRKDLKVSGNIPLVEDKLGMRFALNSKKRDGYLDNVDGKTFGDEERLAVTSRWLWDVSDNFSADLFIYWSKQDELSSAVSCLHQNPDSNVTQLTYPGRRDGFESACNDSEALAEKREVSINSEDSLVTMTSTIYALTLNWGFENFDVKSITGISQQFDIVRNDDQDGSNISIVNNGGKVLNQALAADGKKELDEKRLQISQELQVSGTAFDERLSYTTGIFLSLEEIEDNPFAQFIGPKALAGIKFETVCAGGANQADPGLAIACSLPGANDGSVFPLVTVLGTSSTLTNESWAVFAQGTYDVTDWLQLTIGGRHTVEKRERDLSAYYVDHDVYAPRLRAATMSATDYIPEAGFYSPITAEQLHSAADNNRLPDVPLTIVESLDVREASWRRFTPTVTLAALAPEEMAENWGLSSAMTYFTWSKGFKAGGFEPKGPELTSFDPEDVVNIELGVKLEAFDSRLRFNAAAYSLDYTNIHVRVAEQGPTISDLFLFLSNAGEATVNGIEFETTVLLGNWLLISSASHIAADYQKFDAQIVDPVNMTTSTVDRSNEEFALVPKNSASFAVQYNAVTPIGVIMPRLSAYYRSELFTGIDERAIEYESSTVNSVAIWNGRLTWMPSEQIRVTAFVNNLTDEQYFKSGFAVSALLGAATLVQGEPRSYGLEFAWDFF